MEYKLISAREYNENNMSGGVAFLDMVIVPTDPEGEPFNGDYEAMWTASEYKICVRNVSEMLGLERRPNEPVLLSVTTGNKYGAIAMTAEKVFAKLAKVYDDDLYILPGSKHEILVTTCNGNSFGANYLAKVVQEANRTEVAPEDRLTDSVYTYIREIGHIGIAR